MNKLSSSEISNRPGTRIRSASRAVRLLMHVGGEGATTVTEAAEALGLAVPTTHHLLATLCDEGVVSRDSTRRYVLGPAVGVLARQFEHTDSVAPWLMEPLRDLASSTGETAYLSGWRGDSIRVMASIEGVSAVRVAGTDVGTYHSPHARATGKLLLAYAHPALRTELLGDGPLPALTERTIVDRDQLEVEFGLILDQGWAEDVEEFSDGVCCVSAPVILDDTVFAAFTVSVPTHNFEHRRPDLVAAAEQAAAVAVETRNPRTPEDS